MENILAELTEKQEKALLYIRSVSESTGLTPTLRELCEYMGYSAIGSAQDVVAALRKKGYLQYSYNQKARSLLVTEKGRLICRDDEFVINSNESQTLIVPCLGQIPAGNPVEAINEVVGTLSVSKSLIPRVAPQKLFALQATGLSMINAGICDGDWLVVESTQEAATGDIVVASIEGEATVKRLQKDQNGWYLKPENPDFKPLYAKDALFKVIGRVVALQRTLI